VKNYKNSISEQSLPPNLKINELQKLLAKYNISISKNGVSNNTIKNSDNFFLVKHLKV
jgi:hypothetical protein